MPWWQHSPWRHCLPPRRNLSVRFPVGRTSNAITALSATARPTIPPRSTEALDDLRQHKKHCVLFFPAGTYRLTDTVKTLRKAHTDCMVTVVGEDPATTILRWDGQQGGTIFKYDAWYAKISRLTLDGAGKAKVALAYGNAFSTFNETSDMVFKDVATGMLMGTSGNGQAENAVLRCKFLRCSASGLLTVNFNSMDIWVWDSLFEDCGIGLLNQAGNFHAYHNLFLQAKPWTSASTT